MKVVKVQQSFLSSDGETWFMLYDEDNSFCDQVNSDDVDDDFKKRMGKSLKKYFKYKELKGNSIEILEEVKGFDF